ncbi:hypothetical protein [Nocardia sp. NPDC050175]|uniref:hypothetical protein n=1 Tax=Nocardia sp. NPDC050175 TaxID=3364317 RepID=UPI0037ADCB8A
MITDNLRSIGTGYIGKEPFEYTADVLRNVVRPTGGDLGFETCLTSRPFTAQTYLPLRPGAMTFGRCGPDGPDRASAELADGLEVLEVSGFHVDTLDGLNPEAQTQRRILVAGPFLMPGRWAPSADRLVFGDVWRHVIVDSDTNTRVQPAVVCLDPVAGGYTAIEREAFERPGVMILAVVPPDRPIDTTELARRCLRRGADWRSTDAGENRDHHGLKTAAAVAESLSIGGAQRRLRSTLAAYALHAFRSGALLGYCGPLTIDELALADLLRELVTDCRTTQAALNGRPETLAAGLHRLATTAETVSELYERIAAGSV